MRLSCVHTGCPTTCVFTANCHITNPPIGMENNKIDKNIYLRTSGRNLRRKHTSICLTRSIADLCCEARISFFWISIAFVSYSPERVARLRLCSHKSLFGCWPPLSLPPDPVISIPQVARPVSLHTVPLGLCIAHIAAHFIK